MFILIGNWWAFVLRGAVALLFGLLALLMPSIALLTLVFLFGFYATADGILSLFAAFRKSRVQQQPSWPLVLQGVFGLIAGALAFFLPGITLLALMYIIAAWAIATGVLEIIVAVRLRREITGEWLLGLSGALSIILGVLLAIFPIPGAVALAMWTGAFAMLFGVLLIVLGLKLRSLARAVADQLGHAMPPAAAGH